MRKDVEEKLWAWLHDKEFYEFMQRYRHAPSGDQRGVQQSFDAVKGHIAEKFIELTREER
jgi:hypothetical protein